MTQRAKAKKEIKPVKEWVSCTAYEARVNRTSGVLQTYSNGGKPGIRVTIVPPGYAITKTPPRREGGLETYYAAAGDRGYWVCHPGKRVRRYSASAPNGTSCDYTRSELECYDIRITPARAAAIRKSWTAKGRAK